MEYITIPKPNPEVEALFDRIQEAETDLHDFVKEFFPHQKNVTFLRSPAYISGVVAFKAKRIPEDFEKFGQGYCRPKNNTRAFKSFMAIDSIHINNWSSASGVLGAKSITIEMDCYEVEI